MDNDNVVELSIDLLIPNSHQPRKSFNESSLNELALSIKEYGVLNPILVRKSNEKYEIIAGERRVRASKIAGLNKVPAIIKNIDDIKLAEIALIENLQRENITPIEEANSYKDILDLSNKTEQELSKMIGKSQSFISNKLRLLSLPEEIKNALNNRKISERHARALLSVKDSKMQVNLLERIMKEKLTVKELENIINEKKISEAEIARAIDDIMKSINQIDNKKEEKESDNMNNGNFFPNYNSNADSNNNMSFNNMNMQSLNNMSPMPNAEINGMAQAGQLANNNNNMPTQEVVAPTAAPYESPVQEQQFVYNAQANTPVGQSPMDIPTATIPQENSLPAETPAFNFNQSQTMPNNNSINSPLPDIPLFSSNENSNPMPEPNDLNMIQNQEQQPATVTPSFEVPTQPAVDNNMPTPPVMDAPLFNGNNNNQGVSMMSAESSTNNTNFEVPINEPNITQTDEFTNVKTLLDNNGVSYKMYSNETGHCIIIEL